MSKTKFITSLLAVCLLITTAGANMLTNPGLEDTYIDDYGATVPVDWGMWQAIWEGWGDTWIEVGTENPNTGSIAAKLGANEGYAMLIQEVTAGPGTYTLGAWVADALSGKGSATAPYFKMEYYDSGGALIAGEELLLNHVNGSYVYQTATSTAPEGTAWLKAIALVKQDAGGSSEYFYDDFDLVPEPATLAILGLGGLVLLHRRKRV